MTFPFFGRTKELELMTNLFNQVTNDGSRMLVVTGRRRVGKTALIAQAFSKQTKALFLYFYINSELGEKRNIELFWDVNREKISSLGAYLQPPATFSDLFNFLLELSKTKPIVFVMDEFQNVERINAAFLGDIQRQWDTKRKESKMLFVVSGSVASAMRAIFQNGQAPLFARQDAMINLPPFPVKVLQEILSTYNPSYSPDDLLALFVITGGVAQYVKALMQNQAFTKDDMLQNAISNSLFLSEGQLMLISEFKNSYSINFEILERLANGVTDRNELVSAFPQIDISAHLKRLEEYYRLIVRNEPIGMPTKYKKVRFKLNDQFLRFWFTFIFPYKYMIESGYTGRIIERSQMIFPDYSGRVLEDLFITSALESEKYTAVGQWWDKKGENEIDLICIDDIEKKIVFGEIKRNTKKIDLPTLEEKKNNFLNQCNSKYRNYKTTVKGLSLGDLQNNIWI